MAAAVLKLLDMTDRLEALDRAPARTEKSWMARHPKKPGNSADGHPPTWIEPQLTRLVDEAPDGPGWVHEINQATVAALRVLNVQSAYIDGELAAVRPDGVTSFSRLQAAMDDGRRVIDVKQSVGPGEIVFE
jgi:hypothetical protein